MSDVIVCSHCEAPLANRRAHTRYCDERCRKRARRGAAAAARAARNPDSQVSEAGARVRVSGPTGRAADGHFWPALVLVALRDDPDLAGHAGAWERRFRERGELR